MTIVEFLIARLGEDEAGARRCAPGPWGLQGPARETVIFSQLTGISVAMGWKRDLAHIARHDPARVLADVEAKRKLVEKIAGWRHYYIDEDSWYSCGLADNGDGPGSGCADDDRRGTCDCRLAEMQTEYLALLALPYADHPDYDPAWRP